MNYIRADYAIRRRNKNAQTTTLRVVIIGLVIIAVYWLLSTVQPIPAQNCTVPTYGGAYTQC
jgi:drug/metabolite transporter superfamily protein YnfA